MSRSSASDAVCISLIHKLRCASILGKDRRECLLIIAIVISCFDTLHANYNYSKM